MPSATSRRGFLGLAGAAGAVLLGACSSGGTESGGTPRRGGAVRAVFPGSGAKETMDPHAQRQFVDIARHKAVFDKLVDLGPTLRPVPRLAERWEANGDATLWRFHLRAAVFHDGHVLDAGDVLYSLARILDPKGVDRRARTSLAGIDLGRSRAAGERVVEIALKRPNAELPSLLAMTGTAIVRRGYADPSKPVGTGPFRFQSFTAGRSFTGRRFDDHWERGSQAVRFRTSSPAGAVGALLRRRTGVVAAGSTSWGEPCAVTRPSSSRTTWSTQRAPCRGRGSGGAAPCRRRPGRRVSSSPSPPAAASRSSATPATRHRRRPIARPRPNGTWTRCASRASPRPARSGAPTATP
ncbi:ABC transporter substrate-binding protein [Actinomadura livida]|uniref:ABC-type transport system substrate-binding protein n=1 Tax=Actinomadura livida TaxID=79909 RepID=A0A7W7N241_9ACTN|nr:MULTISPECIES: ABC transporter substrate-binding protein [Actinomadura]MBB4778582.1 ABC-type transport system substrate-binding protein [Actinomadura catellatispora]